MADRFLAIVSVALFVIFLGFVAIWVNEIDLWIVVAIVSAMAVFDFLRELYQMQSGNGESSKPGLGPAEGSTCALAALLPALALAPFPGKGQSLGYTLAQVQLGHALE
jgi:hypothetical protein